MFTAMGNVHHASADPRFPGTSPLLPSTPTAAACTDALMVSSSIQHVSLPLPGMVRARGRAGCPATALVGDHAVGERTADVYADPVSHCSLSLVDWGVTGRAIARPRAEIGLVGGLDLEPSAWMSRATAS